MMDPRLLVTKVEESDKLLRRGDLPAARAAYVALLAEAPPQYHAPLKARIQRVDELMHPQERGAAYPRSVPPQSEQAQAEAAVNAGRLDEAIATYHRLVAGRPDDQLARERLAELTALRAQQARPAPAVTARPAAPPPAAVAAPAAPPPAAVRAAPPAPA
ncbi:MAG: tetratricopeptide repeat protein, partial [Deltaproteobacteria bacterium]|nr:tetratricopeptide repeat protein [Deltaproteobacteria bacterium]